MDTNFNDNGNFSGPGGVSPKPDKSGRVGKIVFFVLIGIVVLIAGIATLALILGDRPAETEKKGSKPSTGAEIEVSDSKEYKSENTDGTLSAVQIAERVKPSVVAVITYKGDNVFGEGSAVVMGLDKSEEYTYFVTCAHIIDTSGTTVKIELQDKTQYDADIVGYDTRTDIGVLRVKAKGFTAAEFGDSTVLKVGEPIYAIGNPGGTAFYGSFTGGYVSAIDRPTSANDRGYTMECIQHDAAINPGNSGGALVNSFGQVVGINSSKIANEQYEGMGFAIPISVAKEIVDDIISNGYVANRARLGISYLPATQNTTYSMVVKANKLPAGSIIIATIDKESSFAGTEVKTGDIIYSVNGKDMTDDSALLKVIEKASAGDTLTLGIARVKDDYSVEKFDVKVKLIEDKGSAESTTRKDKDSGGFTNPFAE